MGQAFVVFTKNGKTSIVLNDFATVVYFPKAKKMVVYSQIQRAQFVYTMDDELYGVPVFVLIWEAAANQDIEVRWMA